MMVAATLAGTAWLTGNIGGYWRYRRALGNPAAVQRALLRSYLTANADTRFGRAHRFAGIRTVEEYQARVPLSSYADVAEHVDEICRGAEGVLTRERIRTLALSSGSVAAAKRIPYTRTLEREFRRAIAPWVVDLYSHRPSLAAGCSYWSITPVATDAHDATSTVPIGFEEDSEYLGAAGKRLVDATLAVPAAVRGIRDIDEFRYVTLLFLLRRRDLRLISVWHPSFLTLLLKAAPACWTSLVRDISNGSLPACMPQMRVKPDPHRARELERIGPFDWSRLWPRLRLVSCWADGHAALYVRELREYLSHVEVQPKGLLATEGVVTLPFGGRTPLAVRSHFFEFLHEGHACLAHQLAPGRVYSVVMTTGGGLYRYRLEDRVEVDGFVGKTPSLRFLGKEDHVSDLCGEKLNDTFVAQAIAKACASAGVSARFALLAPDLDDRPPAYTLYLESEQPPALSFGETLDDLLSANPQYRYCRRLGQLACARVFHVSAPMFPAYAQRCREMGQRLGDVKPLALSSRGGWSVVFQGHLTSCVQV